MKQLLICVAAFNLLWVSFAEAQGLFEKRFPQFSLTLQSIDSSGYAKFAIARGTSLRRKKLHN